MFACAQLCANHVHILCGGQGTTSDMAPQALPTFYLFYFFNLSTSSFSNTCEKQESGGYCSYQLFMPICTPETLIFIHMSWVDGISFYFQKPKLHLSHLPFLLPLLHCVQTFLHPQQSPHTFPYLFPFSLLLLSL